MATPTAVAEDLSSSLSLSSKMPQEKDHNGATPTAPTPAGPAPPPTSNLDDLLTDLNRTPLFMTSLDDTDGAGGTNASLDALRALAYEGTRAEVAANFREQGNECARAKRWTDAREFYTQALDTLTGKLQKKKQEAAAKDADAQPPGLVDRLNGDVGEREVDWLDQQDAADQESKVVDLDEEADKERAIEEACAVNRALCNLELKNYGMATRDCAHALRLNPKNTKAYYRSASALLALDKTDAALNACRLGLAHADKSSASALSALQERVQKRIDYIATVERERVAREQKKLLEALTLKKALVQRGIDVKAAEGNGPDLEDARMALAEPTDADSVLSTPVLLLYPSAGQSELIKAVGEAETIGDVLAMVLPVPWPDGAAYGGPDGKGVECFVETAAGGLRKVGKKVQWARVIQGGGVDLKDGLARVFVLPKGDVDKWIEDFKKRKGK